ncbi:MAG: hypothetical protein AAGD14_05745 [Planctomycetota bacterium]
MSEQVRQLVGLENLLVKARRRFRECEREAAGAEHPRSEQYRAVIERISDQIHSADQGRLKEYLEYLERDLLPRMGTRVEETLDGMVESALEVVDGRHHVQELRHDYADALDRVRAVRERLGLDPFQPLDIRFGLGTHPPHADRRLREAFDLVKGYLRS